MTTIARRISRLDLDGLIELRGETGCWDWTQRRNMKGYALVDVIDDEGRRTTRRAHRLVLEAHLGIRIPDELHAMHLCDRACCVNPAHLVIGSNAANSADRKMRESGVGRHAGSSAA